MAVATKTRGMELNVESLRKALSNVRPAVPPRSPRPILTNVLLADGSVTATDLELRITVPIEGVEGEIALPYERLKSIVMNATGCETISLRSDGSRCHITAGTGKWILPTENADEFPAAAPVTAKPIARLPADQFLAMASTVIAVPDKAESKYAGVLVEFREGSLCLVATDGKRLAVAECEIDQATDDASAFVPKRAMEALMAAAAGRDVIQLETTGTEFIATADDVLVCSLLLSAKFPNWRAFEPDHDTAPTFVTASELRSSCLMASICTSETSKGTRWAIADKGITMTAKSSECGESTAVCSIAECGHKCEFTINPQFAIGWLSTVDPAETVSIEAKDQHSPILFRTETCRVTVMPLEGD